MSEANENQPQPETFEELAYGYPLLSEVLAKLQEDPEVPDTGVRRVEVNTFASGDATYNVYVVDAMEAKGGYIAAG